MLAKLWKNWTKREEIGRLFGCLSNFRVITSRCIFSFHVKSNLWKKFFKFQFSLFHLAPGNFLNLIDKWNKQFYTQLVNECHEFLSVDCVPDMK